MVFEPDKKDTEWVCVCLKWNEVVVANLKMQKNYLEASDRATKSCYHLWNQK